MISAWRRAPAAAVAGLLWVGSLPAQTTPEAPLVGTPGVSLPLVDDPLVQAIDEVPLPRPRTSVVELGAEYEPVDECDWTYHNRPLQEGTRDVVRGVACHSFRWFDGLFGDSEDFPEDEVNGLLIAGAEYTDYFGFDPRLRMRVRAPLPNMDRRFDIILGRVDEDAYISDTQAEDRVFYNPGVINREEDASWLLGLGHRGRGGKSGWDWSAGVRLRFPPVPYAKVQYYHYQTFTENVDLRFRQTFFWRDDDGFGTTSRGDLAWALSPDNALRWEAVATVNEVTDGAEWYVGQTWYTLLDRPGAFSLRAFIEGETDAPVAVREYGFNLIWRRPFTRDWLYLSFGPSLTWPRLEVDEKREASLGFGAWLEMEFGQWRY